MKDHYTFITDYPVLLKTLNDDSVFYTHTFLGIEWYYLGNEGRTYKLQPTHIKRAHGINDSTWRRFIDWLIKVKP